MCPKCDQLYRCEHDHDIDDDGNKIKRIVCSTPNCNHPRYKPKHDNPNPNLNPKSKGIPFQRFFYVPMGPWLKSLFLLPWFLDQIKYGSEKLHATLQKIANESNYTLDDIQDGKLFQKVSGGWGVYDWLFTNNFDTNHQLHQVAEEYPNVASDCLTIFLGIAADGFCPYGKHGGHKNGFKKSKSYSITPITATIYNLPPNIRTRHGAVHIVGLVPGPSYNDIQTFLAPLADELLYYWLVGLDIKYPKPAMITPYPVPPSTTPPSHNTVFF